MTQTSNTRTRPVMATVNRSTATQSITTTVPAPQRPKSKVVVRARLVSYPQTRKHAQAHRSEMIAFRTLMFLFLVVSAYVLSSISGQVAVEKSRREEVSAKSRSQNAAQMETALQARLYELTRPDKIDDWAKENQFEYSGDALASASSTKRSELVAVRD